MRQTSGQPMLSTPEALILVGQHLGDSPRATHTRVVAHLMRRLAEHFGEACELWEVVGLCHDLDYFATANDRSQHGLLTVSWLAGRLSETALQAIAAHDHRTGVAADSRLADMLKVADAMTVIDERLGRGIWAPLDRADPYMALRDKLEDCAYLSDILQRYVSKHAVPFARLADIVAAVPSQQPQ